MQEVESEEIKLCVIVNAVCIFFIGLCRRF